MLVLGLTIKTCFNVNLLLLSKHEVREIVNVLYWKNNGMHEIFVSCQYCHICPYSNIAEAKKQKMFSHFIVETIQKKENKN
jgi:hypothetical protein